MNWRTIVDRYQVATSPDGPWLELTVTDKPEQALIRAKASFDWPVVWVAKMRPVDALDVLPPQEQFFAEARERLAVLHGSAVCDQFEVLFRNNEFVPMVDAMNDAIRRLPEVLVPEIKQPYTRDQMVRPNDFNPNPDRVIRPSLAELSGE
jgi:hypothetical protein